MSSNGDSPGRFGRARTAPHYNDEPPDPVQWSNGLSSLRHQKSSDLALSLDPLPPPPLPGEPPIGPEFDLSDNENCENPSVDIKPVHRFIPDSWKNFFRGSNRSSNSSAPVSANLNTTTEGIRCSPPHSPSVSESFHDKFGGSGGSYNSHKEHEAMLGEHPESMDGRTAHTTAHTVLTYSERVEEYHQRYAYMKSWPGLLRILGCIELLLGAAVFACVCAYIHKDNEWFNMFGYSQPQMSGGVYGMYGDTYYTGPKTPFILVVVGLAWIVTVIILVLGMSMYYRAILLDSNWWPVTEFVINLVLAILYMAAGIVYVRDTTRGGLCYYPVFNNVINAAYCRTEAGQTAAIIFLFVGMLVYLIGAIVCLKLWRHEAARRYREKYGHEMHSELPVAHSMARPRISEPVLVSSAPFHTEAPAPFKAKVVKGQIPPGHIPKPVIVPDYLSKYPAIRNDEERDQYKAVFNDQYSEYKELHAEVHATLKRFNEMDSMMRNLPRNLSSQEESDRINRIFQTYQQRKNDPSFLEKKQRCEYLKNKLSHIKHRIQEYDKVMTWNDGYG
ncbi:MARVEL domain-containing protein 2 isoform 1-T2 [Clarias gariepinus]